MRRWFTVLAYAGGVPDSRRYWQGTSETEAKRALANMQRMFPTVTVRFTEERYYPPLEREQIEQEPDSAA